MPNTFDPIVNQWYYHLDKGQRFFVTAVDEDSGTVEIQHFDGDVEEMSLEEWQELDIDLSVAPENWAGPMDIGERDDLGTDVSETSSGDWNEPGEDYRDPHEERLMREDTEEGDSRGEGFMEESSTE